MGRIPSSGSGQSSRNGHPHCHSQYRTEQKEFEMSLAQENVYKTSSVGMMKDHQSNLSSPRADNILVSNAQSRKNIENMGSASTSQNEY